MSRFQCAAIFEKNCKKGKKQLITYEHTHKAAEPISHCWIMHEAKLHGRTVNQKSVNISVAAGIATNMILDEHARIMFRHLVCLEEHEVGYFSFRLIFRMKLFIHTSILQSSLQARWLPTTSLQDGNCDWNHLQQIWVDFCKIDLIFYRSDLLYRRRFKKKCLVFIKVDRRFLPHLVYSSH